MTERVLQASLAAIQFIEEVTRGTDPGPAYTRLRQAFDIDFKPAQEMHDVPAQKSEDHRGADPSIPGAESGKLTFKVPLYTVAGSESPLISLLKRMGAQVVAIAQKPGDVSAGAADEIHVLDGDNAGLAVGVLVHHNSQAGTSSIRGLIRVQTGVGGTTTECTANQDFATLPVAGDTIEAFDTITPKGGEPDKYFTFKVYRGEGATHRKLWTASGAAGTWQLEQVGPKNLSVISFSFDVDNWVSTEDSVTQTAAAGNAHRSVRGANLLYDGVTMRSKSFSFNPGQVMAEIEDLNAAHGRQGHEYTEPKPVVALEPLHDEDLVTDWQAGDTHDLLLEDLKTDTDAWAWWGPAVQVTDYALQADGNIIRAVPPMECRDPGKSAVEAANLPMYAFGMTH